MEQIGYSLIDAQGVEIQSWGNAPGQCAGIPDMVVLPNGDHVHCPAPGTLQDWRLVPRALVTGSPAAIVFDGTQIVVTRPAPVPEIISDRQFFQQLAIEGLITHAEALAAVRTGDIPAAMAAFITSLSSDQQFAAEMLLCGATQFLRHHPVTIALGVGLSKTSDEMDAIWTAAAAL